MGIRCCLRCGKRYPACWDKCPEYKTEKEQDEAAKEMARKDNIIKGYVHDRKSESKARWQKGFYRRAGSAKSWMGGNE